MRELSKVPSKLLKDVEDNCDGYGRGNGGNDGEDTKKQGRW